MQTAENSQQASADNASECTPNEGARLLMAAGSIAECAEASGLSKRSIASFRRGAIPNNESATKLLVAFGIERGAWRRRPPKYREPSWLGDALAALYGRPAAAEALIRGTIEASGDDDYLRRHDAYMVGYRGRFPGYDIVDAAEAALDRAELLAEGWTDAQIDAGAHQGPCA